MNLLLDFLFLENNFLFSLALAIFLIFASIELLSMFIGLTFSQFLDNILPDIDIDVDTEINGSIEHEITSRPSYLKIISWIKPSGVPLFITLLLFLLVFSGLGFALQSFLLDTVGYTFKYYIAGAIVFPVASLIVRYIGLGIAKVIPKDETSVISKHAFIGKVATIITGDARFDYPAQAKIKDHRGRTHYIMVKPKKKDRILKQGSDVLVTEFDGTYYYGI